MKLIYDLLKNNKVITISINNSTNISCLSYNPQTKILTILFSRGTIYKYNNVEKETVYKISELYYNNQSIGKAFRKYILDKYSFTRYNSEGNIQYIGK